MRRNTSANPSQAIADAQDRLIGAFSVAVAVLGGMYIVARPLSSQLTHFSADAAFAGLLAIIFVCAAGLRAVVSKERCAAPENLIFAAVLWIALFVWGAIRSPNPGASVQLASDAILYVLVLLGGYFAGRLEPSLRLIFMRAIIAMVVVEAFSAVWQVFVELPRMRHQIAMGELIAPDALNSKIGLDRLNGDDAFATFGNPNSLAAYLLVGFFLLLGHAWDPLRARLAGLLSKTKSSSVGWALSAVSILFAALFLVTLYWTGSKGGGVALLMGFWFFALQRLNKRFPILNALTVAGIAALFVLLVLGMAGIIPSRVFGLSMQVRFEYWRSALAMFTRHPLDGVGVGGYGEWYSFFKTPMGWESKDPHNEFICLLAELGVLGPLIYVLIWWLVLRHSGGAEIIADAGPGAPRARDFERPVLIGGAVCMLIYFGAFGVFNAGDISSLMQGHADRQTWAGALQTISLPFLFALTIVLLRRDARLHSESFSTAAEDSPAMLHGFRAAAGAVLMHQWVDFDFKAQAVMTALFLCGGLFWGAADSARKVPPESTPLLKILPGWLTVGFALLMLPMAFWIPFHSGLARGNAQDYQSYLDLIKAHPEKMRADLSAEDARTGILSERADALAYAPIDSEAMIDLALARLAFESREPFGATEREILELLQKAVSLRPLSAHPRVLIGSLHFHRGLVSPAVDARAHFERARAAFAEAHRLYPLHPGFLFMEGDALLLMEEPARAYEKYWAAYELDMILNDPNVYLSAIFSDPRPGIFSRHGSDAKVRAAIDALMTALNGSGASALKNDPRLFMGLLARRASATANLLNEVEKIGASTNAAVQNIARLKRDLLGTTTEMIRVPVDAAALAHAALLHALCVKRTLPADMTPDEKEASKARLEKLRNAARTLQDESIRNGRPGTVPRIFQELIKSAESN